MENDNIKINNVEISNWDYIPVAQGTVRYIKWGASFQRPTYGWTVTLNENDTFVTIKERQDICAKIKKKLDTEYPLEKLKEMYKLKKEENNKNIKVVKENKYLNYKKEEKKWKKK